MDRIKTAQGPAKLATTEDKIKDESESGLTHPNLHRRIVPNDKEDYKLGVYGYNSYRTTISTEYDEKEGSDWDKKEIP